MNAFDIAVVVLCLGALAAGYRMGFVARVASWVGLGVGVGIAAVLAPGLLDALDLTSGTQRVVVAVGVFLFLASLMASLGEVAGIRLRRLIPLGGLRQADRAAGAGAGVFGVLVILWLLVPTLAGVPGDISRLVRQSSVAQLVDRATPRVPAALHALRNQVSQVDFPEVFDRLTPAPRTGVPPPSGAIPSEVEARVVASTVRLTGEACRRVLNGSGFVAAPGVVVTNAHVVAGVDDPGVIGVDGRRREARVVVYDPGRDLAVLEVPGLDQPALAPAAPEVGATGAVFGHPGGQAQVEVSPARIEDRIDARGRDIYGATTTLRDVLVLASELAPGDSGGALVNAAGDVVGVAFAIAPDAPATAYALAWPEVEQALAAARSDADTGACIG